jgi:hypothetical protein
MKEYKGKSTIQAAGGYDISEELYVYGGLATGGFKTTDSGADLDDATATVIKVGAVSSRKKDGTEVFYGVGLTNTTYKNDGATGAADDLEQKSLQMPIIIGMEAEANSWLTLRGSITQDVLLVDSEKTTVGSNTVAETNPGSNSTTFAAGAGLRFNKLTLDGSILASGSQIINAANLLGTVGLTYAF